jgi:glycine cleavage system H protein
MNIPRDLRFTSSHEWVRIRNNIATVGITDYAQAQLSDLTFIELPAVDDVLSASDEAAVVESVKAASDVYAPVSGRVIEINTRVVEQPDIVNRDPFGEGWLFKLEMSDPEEADDLMDADQYEEMLPEDE